MSETHFQGKPRPLCSECKTPMLNRRECGMCYGDDEYGDEWWCDSGEDDDSKPCRSVCCGC